MTKLQRQSGAPNAEPTLATLGRPIATAAQQRQAPRLQPIPGHKRTSRHRQFPIGPPEPSARRTRDSVPWRFSDADQYRATTRASRHGVRETCTTIRIAHADRASGSPQIAAVRTRRSIRQFGLEAVIRCDIHK